MTEAKCKRSWEAEAEEDGRLAGELREAFLRHAAGCRECSRERAALDAIRSAVVALPEPSATPLQRRRLRAEVLREANEAAVERQPWWSVRPLGFAALAGALAIATLVFVVGRVTRTDPPPVVAVAVEPGRFDVAKVTDADWRIERDGPITRVEFHRGTVAIHVEPLKPGQRFLMTLPDGELEVHGTRFIVRADERRTAYVEVTEGIVTLRIQGQPERRLERGDRWAREPVAPASDDGSASAPATSSVAQPPSASPPPSVQDRSVPSNTASPNRPGSGTSEFAIATKAFSSGSYAEADDRLGAFIARHPADPRAEDAAFLRALSRARMGDQGTAAARANAYLRSYPNGLRRHEAEVIARGR